MLLTHLKGYFSIEIRAEASSSVACSVSPHIVTRTQHLLLYMIWSLAIYKGAQVIEVKNKCPSEGELASPPQEGSSESRVAR